MISGGMLFLERMLAIDPSYGSQLHQQTFLRMLAERQTREPCGTDHEHVDACYSQATRDAAQRVVTPPTQHALPLPLVLVATSDRTGAIVHSDMEGGGLW